MDIGPKNLSYQLSNKRKWRMLEFTLDHSHDHSCAYKISRILTIPYTQFLYYTHAVIVAKILRELEESHILFSTSLKGDYHCDK